MRFSILKTHHTNIWGENMIWVTTLEEIVCVQPLVSCHPGKKPHFGKNRDLSETVSNLDDSLKRLIDKVVKEGFTNKCLRVIKGPYFAVWLIGYRDRFQSIKKRSHVLCFLVSDFLWFFVSEVTREVKILRSNTLLFRCYLREASMLHLSILGTL